MGFLKALEKPFRTGRSSAIGKAEAAGQQQIALNQQILDIIKPILEQGGSALGALGTMADDIAPLSFSGAFEEAQESPIARMMAENFERQAGQKLASRGLRRSGGGIKFESNLLNDAILGLADRIIAEQRRSQELGLSTKAQEANIGLGQGGLAINAIKGIGGGAETSAQAAADRASNKENILGGLIKIGSSLASALPI